MSQRSTLDETTADGGQLERFPSEPHRARRWVILTLIVLVASAATVGGAVTWVRHQMNPPGAPGADVAVTIKAGSSTPAIAKTLSRAGVIGDDRVFAYWAKLNGKGPFLAGDYVLKKRSDYSVVAAALTKGTAPGFDRFVVPEGLRLQEVAARVGQLPGRSAERFVQLASEGPARSRYQPAGGTNLEGFLYPSTYFLDKKATEATVIDRMVNAFDSVADDVDLREGANALKLTPYQVVIVASLIEREAKVPEDRARIAEVMYNRLAKSMPLQIDATLLYAQGRTSGSLTDKDKLTASPYNTYLNKGLPPAPIASPGRASLEAALHPDSGPFLYYVVTDAAGHHAFAATLDEHNKNVALARSRGLLK